MWRKIDDLNRPYFIGESDFCVYLREHVQGGYTASPSNQLIFSFKMPVTKRGTPQWYYKEPAIKQFAADLNTLPIPDGSTLIPAPVSKPMGHELYDDRIVRSLYHLQKLRPALRVETVVDVCEPIPSSHSEDGPRNPAVILPYLRLVARPEVLGNYIYLVDDVITTGGHFKAVQNLLNQAYPGKTVVGIFWARHVFS